MDDSLTGNNEDVIMNENNIKNKSISLSTLTNDSNGGGTDDSSNSGTSPKTKRKKQTARRSGSDQSPSSQNNISTSSNTSSSSSIDNIPSVETDTISGFNQTNKSKNAYQLSNNEARSALVTNYKSINCSSNQKTIDEGVETTSSNTFFVDECPTSPSVITSFGVSTTSFRTSPRKIQRPNLVNLRANSALQRMSSTFPERADAISSPASCGDEVKLLSDDIFEGPNTDYSSYFSATSCESAKSAECLIKSEDYDDGPSVSENHLTSVDILEPLIRDLSPVPSSSTNGSFIDESANQLGNMSKDTKIEDDERVTCDEEMIIDTDLKKEDLDTYDQLNDVQITEQFQSGLMLQRLRISRMYRSMRKQKLMDNTINNIKISLKQLYNAQTVITNRLEELHMDSIRNQEQSNDKLFTKIIQNALTTDDVEDILINFHNENASSQAKTRSEEEENTLQAVKSLGIVQHEDNAAREQQYSSIKTMMTDNHLLLSSMNDQLKQMESLNSSSRSSATDTHSTGDAEESSRDMSRCYNKRMSKAMDRIKLGLTKLETQRADETVERKAHFESVIDSLQSRVRNCVSQALKGQNESIIRNLDKLTMRIDDLTEGVLNLSEGGAVSRQQESIHLDNQLNEILKLCRERDEKSKEHYEQTVEMIQGKGSPLSAQTLETEEKIVDILMMLVNTQKNMTKSLNADKRTLNEQNKNLIKELGRIQPLLVKLPKTTSNMIYDSLKGDRLALMSQLTPILENIEQNSKPDGKMIEVMEEIPLSLNKVSQHLKSVSSNASTSTAASVDSAYIRNEICDFMEGCSADMTSQLHRLIKNVDTTMHDIQNNITAKRGQLSEDIKCLTDYCREEHKRSDGRQDEIKKLQGDVRQILRFITKTSPLHQVIERLTNVRDKISFENATREDLISDINVKDKEIMKLRTELMKLTTVKNDRGYMKTAKEEIMVDEVSPSILEFIDQGSYDGGTDELAAVSEDRQRESVKILEAFRKLNTSRIPLKLLPEVLADDDIDNSRYESGSIRPCVSISGLSETTEESVEDRSNDLSSLRNKRKLSLEGSPSGYNAICSSHGRGGVDVGMRSPKSSTADTFNKRSKRRRSQSTSPLSSTACYSKMAKRQRRWSQAAIKQQLRKISTKDDQFVASDQVHTGS